MSFMNHLSDEIAALEKRLEEVEAEKKSLKKKLKALTSFLSELSKPNEDEDNGN